jgi:hypothetical protein
VIIKLAALLIAVGVNLLVFSLILEKLDSSLMLMIESHSVFYLVKKRVYSKIIIVQLVMYLNCLC